MKGIQNMKDFSKSIKYIGADDKDLDLFESQYIITNGVSYNSYVVMDEKLRLWILWTQEKQTNGLQILKPRSAAGSRIIL